MPKAAPVSRSRADNERETSNTETGAGEGNRERSRGGYSVDDREDLVLGHDDVLFAVDGDFIARV
jgi:hypothetical protein